jgi:hypothetical protein
MPGSPSNCAVAYGVIEVFDQVANTTDEIAARLAQGWSVERALTEPLKREHPLPPQDLRMENFSDLVEVREWGLAR